MISSAIFSKTNKIARARRASAICSICRRKGKMWKQLFETAPAPGRQNRIAQLSNPAKERPFLLRIVTGELKIPQNHSKSHF